MRLTSKNYYSPSNTYLSSSKVHLFMKSKEAYKKRYIDFEVDSYDTRSIRIGRMVDLAFEKGSVDAIFSGFPVKALKKDNPTLYEAQKSIDSESFVTKNEQDEAVNIAKKIIESDLYKWYKQKGMRRYFQKIVKDKKLQICGMIDVLTVDPKNKICYIDDLKTSATSDMMTAKSWYWKCVKYGYLMQMAVYKELVSRLYPDYEIVCRHIVVGTTDFYPVRLYLFTKDSIAGYFDLFLSVVEAIRKEREFKDYVPTWEMAEEIVGGYGNNSD